MILAKTVKGWTLGEGTEGRNITHQVKHLAITDLKSVRDRIELPIPDAQLVMLWVLTLSDGEHSLLDIAERAGVTFEAVEATAAVLEEHGLLIDA